MKTTRFKIDKIPAILWGDSSKHLVIAVHGNMSSKEDVPIQLLANIAVEKGYQVLSFDLPEHGDRMKDPTLCHIDNILEEFKQIECFIEGKYETISLFANSMGTYFSLVGWKDLKITQAYFLSPVVDMLDIIENMMLAFSISEEELSKKKVIPTPIGQTLYLDYYQYVKTHPIKIWDVKTTILYGELDEMCGYDKIKLFCEKFSCELEVVKGAKHYFHTPKELNTYQQRLKKYFQK